MIYEKSLQKWIVKTIVFLHNLLFHFLTSDSGETVTQLSLLTSLLIEKKRQFKYIGYVNRCGFCFSTILLYSKLQVIFSLLILLLKSLIKHLFKHLFRKGKFVSSLFLCSKFAALDISRKQLAYSLTVSYTHLDVYKRQG